jgi:Asp-tRNA(Asn)/Glu-tRNA(Gln) amidotransferase A subunit family amidase
MNEVIFATVHEMAAAIRLRQVSVRDVLEAHLQHIAQQNPQWVPS